MGTPRALPGGNVYWWGGLFHGVHKGSLSYLNEKIEQTFITEGRIEIPGNIPLIGGYQFANVSAEGLLRGSQSGIEKAWLGARVSFHVVFFDYRFLWSRFHTPAHPAFYVNGIRVPFSVSAHHGRNCRQTVLLDETVPSRISLSGRKMNTQANLIFSGRTEHPGKRRRPSPGRESSFTPVCRREKPANSESYYLVEILPRQYYLEIENAQN
jgi:hypothetical protein